jgi:hypothetical protein
VSVRRPEKNKIPQLWPTISHRNLEDNETNIKKEEVRKPSHPAPFFLGGGGISAHFG